MLHTHYVKKNGRLSASEIVISISLLLLSEHVFDTFSEVVSECG